MRSLLRGILGGRRIVGEAPPPHWADMLAHFAWGTNAMPELPAGEVRFHFGCGERLLPGFVNADLLPESPEVLRWDVLGLWPEGMDERISMVFAEDVIEHFFYAEQAYILACVNCALRPGGVFRVLMPSLEKLVNFGRTYRYPRDRDDFLTRCFGFRTGADLVNLGMRFGGHRWLHDGESIAQLARSCGFEPTLTSCRESTEPALTGLNLRSESDSFSFACDLRKTTSLRRWRLDPTSIVDATEVGRVAPGQPIYRAETDDPQVHYRLPESIRSERIAVLDFHGANLTQLHEHNHATIFLVPSAECGLPVDRSMASTAANKMLSEVEIAAKVRDREIVVARIDPSQKVGDHFTVGPLEIFLS